MSYGIRCFLLENVIMHIFWVCYNPSAVIGYVNVRHLDVVSAKARFTPCGFYPVFVLKTKATRWCPLKPTQCRSDEITVQLTNFLVIIFCLFGGIISWSALR